MFTKGVSSNMFRWPGWKFVAAVAIAVSVALSGCGSFSNDVGNTAPAGVAAVEAATRVAPLRATDTNLIFVVTPDLAHDVGDLNVRTANLTNQGLQRALKLAAYLHTTLLNSANVSGIYALEPATHPQTSNNYPDLVPLETIEQFALLNTYSENVAQPPSIQNVIGDSFPISVSYSPGSVPAPPPTVAPPPAFPASCQGLDFADNGGDNEILVNSIIGQGRGGYYVFALPFETFQSLVNNLKTLNSYDYTVPGAWQGPNSLYVLAVPRAGPATLATYDTHIDPGGTYPVLTPAWQDSPSQYQAPFVIQSSTLSGSTLPADINTNETIHFVRHGEAHPTPAWDDGNLIMPGNWRALYLPTALAGKIETPDFVYGPDPAGLIPGPPPSNDPTISFYSYIRPSMTVAPYAIANGLPLHVTTGFYPGRALDDPQVTAAAKFFFTGGQFSNKTLLVGWEHNNIPWIGQALLNLYFASNPPQIVPTNTSWPGDDYDTIWTFNLDGNGNLTLSNTTCEGINSATLPSTAPLFH